MAEPVEALAPASANPVPSLFSRDGPPTFDLALPSATGEPEQPLSRRQAQRVDDFLSRLGDAEIRDNLTSRAWGPAVSERNHTPQAFGLSAATASWPPVSQQRCTHLKAGTSAAAASTSASYLAELGLAPRTHAGGALPSAARPVPDLQLGEHPAFSPAVHGVVRVPTEAAGGPPASSFAPKSKGQPVGAPLGKTEKGGKGKGAYGEANVSIRGSKKHKDVKESSGRSSAGSGGSGVAAGGGSTGELAVQVKGGKREKKQKGLQATQQAAKEEEADGHSDALGEHPVAIKGLKKGKGEKTGRDAPGHLQRWGQSAAETAKQLASASAERAAQLGSNAAETAKQLASASAEKAAQLGSNAAETAKQIASASAEKAAQLGSRRPLASKGRDGDGLARE